MIGPLTRRSQLERRSAFERRMRWAREAAGFEKGHMLN